MFNSMIRFFSFMGCSHMCSRDSVRREREREKEEKERKSHRDRDHQHYIQNDIQEFKERHSVSSLPRWWRGAALLPQSLASARHNVWKVWSCIPPPSMSLSIINLVYGVCLSHKKITYIKIHSWRMHPKGEREKQHHPKGGGESTAQTEEERKQHHP